MSKLSALGLIAILGGAQALGACASSSSNDAPEDARSKPSTILGQRIEPAPTAVTPGEQDFQKKPGLLSGKDGEFTIFQKHDRGSADPSKPEKLRR